VLSIYLYIIIALIVLLVVFIVRQIRLRQAIARRRALRERELSNTPEE
jgi:hypothetical protein